MAGVLSRAPQRPAAPAGGGRDAVPVLRLIGYDSFLGKQLELDSWRAPMSVVINVHDDARAGLGAPFSQLVSRLY